MCDPPVNYHEGDIVWVKLGSSWWPGEVKDINNLPSDVDFKKAPLAVVKFFDEDSYEYVKNSTSIYPYNSERKNEFIKKGMASFRSKVAHMEKFPKDVTKAEEVTGGNPNILSDPMFRQENKKSFIAEVFGSPSPKKTPKDSAKKNRTPANRAKESKAHITHRRFLGYDDYEAHILIQYPGKHREDESDCEEIIQINQEPQQEYKCSSCNFITKRLEVMILHNKAHMQGWYRNSPTPKRNKKITKKTKKVKTPRVKSKANKSVIEAESSSDEIEVVKKTPKKQKKETKKKQVEEPKGPTDIRSDLLAEWDSDDDNDASTSNESFEKTTQLPEKIIESDSEKPTESEENETKKPECVKEVNDNNSIKEAIKSCFDFDEEEEEETPIVSTTAGRKIPRVIPPTEKRKSNELEDLKFDDLKSKPKNDDKTQSDDELSKENDEIELAFKELMDTTVAPELPDINNSLKCEQNFHSVKTIKFPDKKDPDPPQTAETESNLQLESTLNESVVPAESTSLTECTPPNESIPPTESISPIDSTPKTELPRTESTFECKVKSSDNEESQLQEEPIGPSQMECPDKKTEGLQEIPLEEHQSDQPQKEVNTEVATKLTNPKKRFVKSFEDFELLQNQQRLLQAQDDNSYSCTSSPEKESFREENINEKNNENKSEISDLKSEVTSKLESESKTVPLPLKSRRLSGCHRTPRSKILESYRNESNASVSTEDKSDENSTHTTTDTGTGDLEEKKEIYPPKKSRWSRRRSSSTLPKKEPPPQKERSPKGNQIQSPNKTEPSPSTKDILSPRTNILSPNTELLLEDEKLTPLDDISLKGVPFPSKIFSHPENLTTDDPKEAESLELNEASKEKVEESDCSPKDCIFRTIDGTSTKAITNDIETDIHTEQPTNPKLEIQSEDIEISTENNVSKSSSDESFTLRLEEDDDSIKNKPVTEDKNDKSCDDEKIPSFLEESTFEEKTPQPVSETIPENIIEDRTHFTIEENTNVPDLEEENRKEISDTSSSEPNFNIPLLDIPVPPEPESMETEISEVKQNLVFTDTVVETESNSLVTEVLQSQNQIIESDTEIEKQVIGIELENKMKHSESEITVDQSLAQNQVENSIEEVESEETVGTGFTSKINNDDSLVNEQPFEDFPIPVETKIDEEPKIAEVVETTEHNLTTTDDSVDIAHDTEVALAVESSKELTKVKVNNIHEEEESSNLEKKLMLANDKIAEDHENEVVIACSGNNELDEDFKISIKTNLSNFSKAEEISALTLAGLSDFKSDSVLPKEDVKAVENIASIENKFEEKLCKNELLAESELIAVDANLKVVSEQDLADGQVEISASNNKPVTLMSFSMDFSESTSDSNSLNEISESDTTRSDSDFPTNVNDIVLKSPSKKVINKYERLELLDILEGKSSSESESKDNSSKNKNNVPPVKKNITDDICDFEEHIPSQIVRAKGHEEPTEQETEDKKLTDVEKSSSKLLKRLTEKGKNKDIPKKPTKIGKLKEEIEIPSAGLIKTTPAKTIPAKTQMIVKNSKYVIKPGNKPAITSDKTVGKPIILSEKIIKPATKPTPKGAKRSMNDIEDVEAFVIHKGAKKIALDPTKQTSQKSTGKAKILQQTIITPAGEIIQPNITQTDENVFDINSMPIVLSDQILTPESIENMPIVLGAESVQPTSAVVASEKAPVRKQIIQNKILNKSFPSSSLIQQAISKTPIPGAKLSKTPRILHQAIGNRVLKQNSPLIPSTGKPGKYIIVPQTANVAGPTKFITKKPPTIVKKTTLIPSSNATSKIHNMTPEPSGNKIMIVTNQQGQQQRLLLTPAQQKMLGYQPPGTKITTKTIVKGNVIQKSVLAAKPSQIMDSTSTSGIGPKIPNMHTIISKATNSSQAIVTTGGQIMGQITPQSKMKGVTKKIVSNQKVYMNTSAKTNPTPPRKTILIKNQHGQTVRKIQGTDDALLDKQVAEQLKAIKASSSMKFQQKQEILSYKGTPKTAVRRSYAKANKTTVSSSAVVTSTPVVAKSDTSVPPLAPFSPSKKTEQTKPNLMNNELKVEVSKPTTGSETKTPIDRPLNQLVIQDAMGNQTTITEGQILALPSETVDGQPQSYMLVTLDESGNLTPLNSEALMSLDPNLGLGGDLSNMVLQIDQGTLTANPADPSPLAQTATVKSTAKEEVISEPPKQIEIPVDTKPAIEQNVVEETILENKTQLDESVETAATSQPEIPQPVANAISSEPGQQLIVTGDPIATQKFLESLTEGTTDLANILANAEGGSSILIQADGQQILINTNSDSQMLLSVNNDNLSTSESTEGGGNPIFATQPSKNQDILAAALADTDVFQQDPRGTQSKLQSQLSPNSTLYPMNVGNVLETSLTLNSPIMTPLEVPSTNNKKIPDEETDILTQVPKNVALPITITDPNISQTVSQQQVASLIANELQANLELNLPISESTMTVSSTEMNSPSYVYSLPTLDDSVDINQKPFNSSMPLLTEDVEDTTAVATSADDSSRITSAEGSIINTVLKTVTSEEDKKTSCEIPLEFNTEEEDCEKVRSVITSDGTFMEEEEGLCTLGGEMCSSLSEPPPDMFDLPSVRASFMKTSSEITETTSNSNLSSVPCEVMSSIEEEVVTDISHAQIEDASVKSSSSDDSCEIPVQPQIVTSLSEDTSLEPNLKRSLEDEPNDIESKKCKFD